MTNNMLRSLRINPNLSAYAQTFGMLDYNRIPLAPLGTTAYVRERPKQRASHADHGKIGYVIGPSMKKHAVKSKDTIPFTSKAENGAIAALKNIIAPNRSENKKDISAPRLNLMLPKENDATLPRVPQTEDAALPRINKNKNKANKQDKKANNT